MASHMGMTDKVAQTFPLPLAQLYRRGLNAKTPLERHQAAYYLWEVALKLLSALAVAEYADLYTESEDHDPEVAKRLRSLARPSLGHWWEFLRLLAPILAEKGDDGFRQIEQTLLVKSSRDDLPRTAGLDAALRESLGESGGARATVKLRNLIDRFLQYRNRELGHGALGQKPDEHYERMSRTLLAAGGELFSRCDPLAGQRLIYIADVRRRRSGDWEIDQFELMGESERRLEPLVVPESQSERLPNPERLYARAQNGTSDDPLTDLFSLHPLVVYDREDSDVMFLNSRRGRAKVEYLSYISGEVIQQEELAGMHQQMLARVLDIPIDSEEADRWADDAQREDEPEQPDVAPRPTRHVGEFEILAKIGVGAMGDVYRAWQPSLGRQVALKCMRRVGDSRAESRFAREIRALGRVDHPNLVRVFTSGSEAEHWFYAMELVEGATLSRVFGHMKERASTINAVEMTTWDESLGSACQETRNSEASLSKAEGLTTLDSDEELETPPQVHIAQGSGSASGPPVGSSYIDRAVELVRQVTEAAAALHQANIIHRDIKPENIVVSPEGDRAVLMDLGLAKLIDDDQLSRTREFIGTLRYASPEQVVAVGEIDFASDVYSIGVVLWEMLALSPIYRLDGQTPSHDLMNRIQFEEPERLRKINPRIPRELEAIVFKCLEKNPKKRYPTARELADDLAHWQRGESVSVRTRSALNRFVRKIKRHRGRLMMAAVMVAVVFGVWWWARRGLLEAKPTAPPAGSGFSKFEKETIQGLYASVADHHVTPVSKPYENRRVVDRLPAPDPEAFEIIEYLRVCDLRSWRPLPKDQLQLPGSAVVIMQRERIRKLKDVHEFHQRTRTSGYEVYLRCMAHPDASDDRKWKYGVLVQREPTVVRGTKLKVRQMSVDVSDIPVHKVFAVQGVYSYWNAFQREDQRWTGTTVDSQARKIAFLVILPKDRPFTNYRLKVSPKKDAAFKDYGDRQFVYEDPRHRFIYWEIRKPAPGAFYKLEWDW